MTITSAGGLGLIIVAASGYAAAAAKSNGMLSHVVTFSSADITGHARYVQLSRFSFLILIGRFVTLEP